MTDYMGATWKWILRGLVRRATNSRAERLNARMRADDIPEQTDLSAQPLERSKGYGYPFAK
jgi:hypothetical protein